MSPDLTHLVDEVIAMRARLAALPADDPDLGILRAYLGIPYERMVKAALSLAKAEHLKEAARA